jgi:predicted nucleic acid-binding protein
MPEFVLADTSIWITHFREGRKHFIELLEQSLIACHPYIIGELACGNLKNRTEIIKLLEALPTVNVLEHNEVMDFIERRELMGIGIGYVDVHLLGSSLLSDVQIWTFDTSLIKAATALNISYSEK